MKARTSWLLLGLWFAGCDKKPADALENAPPSPNASILPAPLTSQAQPAAEVPPFPGAAASSPSTSAARMISLDGGVGVPQTLRSDEPPADDVLAAREFAGVSLQAEWRPGDLPATPRTPEVNVGAIESARRTTTVRTEIDLAALGRMRMTFDSRATPLARGSELRARFDRYGHVVVWPDRTRYRVLPPGGLRSLLAEGRADAVPLVRPQSSGKLDGQRRFGLPTKKWELTTRTGRVTLEQARIPAAGEGGVLLCRMLVELLTVDPSAAPCGFEDVPLRAQFTWPDGGNVLFEVVRIADKVDLASSELSLTPGGAAFVAGELPAAPPAVLSRDELATFRLRAVDVPPSRSVRDPEEGIALHNGTDLLRYVWIDGVPAVSVWPGRNVTLLGLARGRYLVQWRSFLSDAVDPATVVDVPGRSAVGEHDR